MKDRIGETAGYVWQQLAQQGPMTVNRLKDSVGVPPELLHQALGWLAREDKLNMEKNGRGIKISLK